MGICLIHSFFFIRGRPISRSLGKTLPKLLPNFKRVISHKTFFFIDSERSYCLRNLGFLTDSFAHHSTAYGSSAKLCLDRSVSGDTNQLVDTVPHINTQWSVQERFKSFGRWGPLGQRGRAVDREVTGSTKPHFEPGTYQIRTTGWTIRSSNSGRVKRFLSSPQTPQTGFGAHPACYSLIPGFFRKVKSAKTRRWQLNSVYIRDEAWVELFIYSPYTWTQTNLLSPAKRDAGAPPTRSRLEEGTMKLRGWETTLRRPWLCLLPFWGRNFFF